MRVLLNCLKAVSTLNQARLIKSLIEKKGFVVEHKNTISIWDVQKDDVHAILWFQLATVPFLADVVAPWIFAKKPKALYVTIEGIPTRGSVLCSNIPKLTFIANSEFTAKCLRQLKLRVKDVVHHAINLQQIRNAQKLARKVKAELDKKYGPVCKLLFVGRNDPRKRLDLLSKAVDILNEKGVKKWVLLLHTERTAENLFKKPHCEIISDFGSLTYEETLALMGACDYLVFPSSCEGFGLPLLEANAMGKPVLHCWAPPMSEFSSEDFNFVWEYIETRFVKCGNAQYWIFHEYDHELLAHVMEDAIRIYHEEKKEYERYCQKAYNHAKKWNYRKIYPKLLKYLAIK